jgi:hypothetical protein
VFIYIALLIRFIDCGGKPDEISNYLLELELHKYNYDKFYSDSKNKKELEHLKEKITPEINSAFVKKLLQEYALSEPNYDWFRYNKLYKINDDIIKIFLEETNNTSLSQNHVLRLFNFCLYNLETYPQDVITSMITPYLNTEQKCQIWKEFLDPIPVRNVIAVENETDKYRVQKEKDQQFLNEHIEDIRCAVKQYQYILLNLSLENEMDNPADISRIENEWGADIAGAYREGIKKILASL